ncbi:MAG TPA: glycosyltransferase [Ramlibacter sp.]|uniref:glycosyltransferase n=1 Tax=Ramlibacter sp. TaxID=1917967 RepID=UPI002ED2A125
MKILFVHQNFPAQFKHVAPALAAMPGNTVVALTMRKIAPGNWRGVRVVPYAARSEASRTAHAWVAELESKVLRGEACLHAALSLKKEGFEPDVVVAHPAWGESLFLQDVWPRARIGIYCEFFYQSSGADVGFDPEFDRPEELQASRLRIKNANYVLHSQCAAAGIAPTQWQAGTFPEPFRSRIAVIHDGIDTGALRPDPSARVVLRSRGKAITLTRADEVVTFVSRNLEPYRGFHVFMRCLPELLGARPRARILVVGGEEASYGPPPPGGGSWKEVFAREVRPRISDADWQRVHFLGQLEYGRFVALLQVSTVHVYLTYPFVLSWSLLEAMSCGCAVVASDTAPVREVVRDGETGRLVSFFDPSTLARTVGAMLDDACERERLGIGARKLVAGRYDLARVCLPRQLEWVDALADARA